MENQQNIIEKLKQYRLENRLSQKKLAESLKVTFATVNRWFKGRCKPNEIQLYHIEKILNGGQ
jgi:transcriptional regulator with XRE-family HTH domain